MAEGDCCVAQDYDPRWVAAFKMISDGVFGDVEYFEDLVASVNQIPERGNDWFLLANDFATYMDAQVWTCTPLSDPGCLLHEQIETNCAPRGFPRG